MTLGRADDIVLHALGDAQRLGGKSAEAIASYDAAIAAGSRAFELYFDAAWCRLALDRDEEALRFLQTHKVAIEGHAHYTERLTAILQKVFDKAGAMARQLYLRACREDDPRARDEADAVLDEALRLIERATAALRSYPPCREVEGGHVVILGNDDIPQCTHYRIRQKIEQFALAGIAVRFVSHNDTASFGEHLVDARVAIFYRVPAFPEIIHAILTARALGVPTYYEIDDLIFDPAHYPDEYGSYQDQISVEDYAALMWGVPLFRYAIAMCDTAIASTRPLAVEMERIVRGGRCLVLPNALSGREEEWFWRARPPEQPPTIFYGSGTRAHNRDFAELAAPAIRRMMAEHPALRLVVAGHLPLGEEWQPFRDRITALPFVADLDAYWSVLKLAAINIAVLAPNRMADCKSEIKWLEAAARGVPSVVSPTQTYRGVIEDGVNGLLAATPDDWYRALGRLITDPAARHAIGEQARVAALARYAPSSMAAILKAEFASSEPCAGAVAHPAPRALARRRPRLLIGHVFFAPQSIGGATRVVEDNVADLLAMAPDFDFTIVCADEGGSPPGRVRLDQFGRAEIIRIATPVEVDMDWRPFNPRHGEIFATILDRVRPDLVHFHCVQRLTASLVEVALERRVPYLVTLHDAWWFCDDQFLIDRDSFLREPSPDLIGTTLPDRDPVASIARRARLGALLAAAEARLTVSDAFAAICAGFGVADVRVVENGIQPARRGPAPAGRRKAAPRPYRRAFGPQGGGADRGDPAPLALLQSEPRHGRWLDEAGRARRDALGHHAGHPARPLPAGPDRRTLRRVRRAARPLPLARELRACDARGAVLRQMGGRLGPRGDRRLRRRGRERLPGRSRRAPGPGSRLGTARQRSAALHYASAAVGRPARRRRSGRRTAGALSQRHRRDKSPALSLPVLRSSRKSVYTAASATAHAWNRWCASADCRGKTVLPVPQGGPTE